MQGGSPVVSRLTFESRNGFIVTGSDYGNDVPSEYVSVMLPHKVSFGFLDRGEVEELRRVLGTWLKMAVNVEVRCQPVTD
jgi:hypothetical protein